MARVSGHRHHPGCRVNSQAVLALLGDLYNQLGVLQQENERLRAEVVRLEALIEAAPDPTAGVGISCAVLHQDNEGRLVACPGYH